MKNLINILGSKLNLNEKDVHGNFATIIAAQRNDFELLKLLVDSGAKLDLKDGFGRTVREWAEKYKNTDRLKFIDEQANCSKNFVQDTGLDTQLSTITYKT